MVNSERQKICEIFNNTQHRINAWIFVVIWSETHYHRRTDMRDEPAGLFYNCKETTMLLLTRIFLSLSMNFHFVLRLIISQFFFFFLPWWINFSHYLMTKTNEIYL